MSGLSSSQNTFGLPNNKYGLVDKQREAVGLQEKDIESSLPSITERENLIMFDTRDCVGELSLREAQLAFAYNAATTGKIEPEDFKRSLNADGVVVPSKLVSVVSGLAQIQENENANSNANKSLMGFPRRKSDNTPHIENNEITFRLPKKLKIVKSFEIINAIIPRDIIPVYVYFPGFVNNCIPGETVDYLNPKENAPSSVWESPVPETNEDFYDKSIQGISSNKLGGVYYTPLRYWRSYTGPNCMSNPHTPPPYQLWNPPQDTLSDDPWPFQPQPVQNQRVPTYRARNGVIFAGYGLYDLDDFPVNQQLQLVDGTLISIPLRKLILKLIVTDGQYVNGISAENIIDISEIDDFNDSGVVDNPLLQTGYGDYQRFIPGPGVAMNYQPNQWRNGKSAPIDMSVSTFDQDTGQLGPMPVPFPNFRGHVWGPYGRPGDRFQNKGLQTTVDELYMNGDTSNLEGNPIIWSSFNPSEEEYTFEYFITSLKRSNNIVRFQTLESASNPNIKNSMRVEFSGGFGAVFAYVGKVQVSRGIPGPIITGGLPNTQYNGNIPKFNHDIWITPRADIPTNWIDSLPGPQKPTIVKSDTFDGWLYLWRDIFPWTGQIYVPVTAGGTGPMEYFDGDKNLPEWKRSAGSSENSFLTTGSSEWSDSPVIGLSNKFCIPSSNPSTFEFVSNLGYGRVLVSDLIFGGNNYQDSFVDYTGTPTYACYQFDTIVDGTKFSTITQTIKSLSVDAVGTILTFNSTDISDTTPVSNDYYLQIAFQCPEGNAICSENKEIVTSGNNASFIVSEDKTTTGWGGGSNYKVADNNICSSVTGSGSGLKINITEITILDDYIDYLAGTPTLNFFSIKAYTIENPGSGYAVNDVVRVLQNDSDNNAYIKISSVSPKVEVISEYNSFHYIDPKAVGPGVFGNENSLIPEYVNGIDTCNTLCTDAADNCDFPGGEYRFNIGLKIATGASSGDDPRPTPDPPSLLKCDFLEQVSPEDEWNAGDQNCRPQDNVRQQYTRNYVANRVSYNDLGSNNGTLIISLLNYRSFFVSSTPDTDLIIKINEAEREVYTQSLNATVNESNFYIPIRLNLGTSSGTLEYVEAVAGTLTSSGVYWKKDYFPPKAVMQDIKMTLWTYDGTPIPLERCLGFVEQFSAQALLFSSSIASSFIIHGSYEAFAPSLPPFTTTYSTTPSNVILTGNTNSKTLSDPYDPRMVRYTQRNLGLIFKAVTYHGQNPGINHIIKRMPDNLIPQTETFQDGNGEEHNLIPLAGNIDEYNF